jgi:hypothetical protein
MFYFKTISIKNASTQLVEKAIQYYTIKRNSYIDFMLTSHEVHDNKFFSGFETNNALLLTRMKNKNRGSTLIVRDSTNFRYNPIVIIRFKKDKGFSSCQIRLGFFTTLIWCILSLAVIVFAISWLKNYLNARGFFVVSGLYVFLLVRIYLEIDLTKKCLNKTIQSAESFADLKSQHNALTP